MYLYSDGVRLYSSFPGRWDAWNYQSSFPTINTTGGRYGGAAIVFAVPNSWAYLTKNVGTQSSIYAGFALNYSSGNNPQQVIAFCDSGTIQVDLRVSSAGNLIVTRNGTTLGTSSNQIPFSQWNYVEVGVVFGSGTAGSVIVRVGETVWLNLTGINTIATANASANQVNLGFMSLGMNSLFASFADIYIVSGAGSSLNTFLGDVTVSGSVPNGNGSLQGYTANWATIARSTAYSVGATLIDPNSNVQRVVTAGTTAVSAPTFSTGAGNNTTDGSAVFKCLGAQSAYLAVSELPPDGDTSYLLSGTVGDQSTFTFPSVPANATIVGAAVLAYAEKDAGGTRAIRPIIYRGGSVYDSGADITLPGGYAYVGAFFATDPVTGAAWTAANWNASEKGIKTTV